MAGVPSGFRRRSRVRQLRKVVCQLKEPFPERSEEMYVIYGEIRGL